MDEKNVVMIIARSNFRDEEFQKPKDILEKRGIKVTVASSSKARATGMFGATAQPTLLIGDVNVDEFDAVIFVDGTGANEYWDDPTAHHIAREAMKQDKLLCAICIAPVTLANAGVLKARRATVWPSEANKLKAKGASYTASQVEVDGRLITASGPEAAERFGDAIVSALIATR